MGKGKAAAVYEQWVDIFKEILIIFVVVGHGYYEKLILYSGFICLYSF